jgi:hypothetical protein
MDKGVGDDELSYAYDGNRIYKWNGSPTRYGEGWAAGDVIGCLIDLDIGDIRFYRNGRDLG